jgi:hypothetical protein
MASYARNASFTMATSMPLGDVDGTLNLVLLPELSCCRFQNLSCAFLLPYEIK